MPAMNKQHRAAGRRGNTPYRRLRALEGSVVVTVINPPIVRLCVGAWALPGGPSQPVCREPLWSAAGPSPGPAARRWSLTRSRPGA